MTLAHLLLVCAVCSYGVDGVLLTKGSQAEGGALRSKFWWLGTMLQGVGFLLTFAAREHLPLLFVQAASVAALAVTALLGQLLGMHRLRWLDGVAIVAMIAGLAMLGISTHPGPADSVHRGTVAVLLGSLLLSLPLARASLPAWAAGLLSGVGFGVGAVAARLLAAAPGRVFWHFWQWSITDWVHALVIPAGLAVGQLFLTKALATGRAVPALGAMYLSCTVLPIVIGLALLHELPRAHTELLVVAGVTLTLLAAWRLMKLEAEELVEPPLPL